MMKKIWCGFHKKMEPADNFHVDRYSSTGYKNCCKTTQCERVKKWQDSHIEYKRAVARVHSEYRRAKITMSQKQKKLGDLRLEFNI